MLKKYIARKAMAKFTKWGGNIATELFPTYSSQTQREKPEKNEILLIRTWQLPVIIRWHVQPELEKFSQGNWCLNWNLRIVRNLSHKEEKK